MPKVTFVIFESSFGRGAIFMMSIIKICKNNQVMTFDAMLDA